VPVLVDTSVWSLALRRNPQHLNQSQAATVADLQELLRDGQVHLIGPVRQELLTGIRERKQFERLRDYLRGLPDAELSEADYENAAAAGNRCISGGIAINNVDLLICAVSMDRRWEIYTTDDDFLQYARRLPIRLRGRAGRGAN
jgi:predicted nucleic acid-binding protein